MKWRLADSYIVKLLCHNFNAPTGGLETLKTTRFRVGFRTLDHMQLFDLAKAKRSGAGCSKHQYLNKLVKRPTH